MVIDVAQLKQNVDKYISLSSTEDILIVDNGRIVAMLTNVHREKTEIAKSLFGIASSDADEAQLKAERLSKI